MLDWSSWLSYFWLLYPFSCVRACVRACVRVYRCEKTSLLYASKPNICSHVLTASHFQGDTEEARDYLFVIRIQCEETWTLYRKHIKQLERFHMRALRSIMGIKWQDRVTNLEVLDRASLASIETMVLKAQLQWTGHVIRMEPFRLPRQLLYGELRQGQRPRGRPKKRFKDWRSLTRQDQEVFETNRCDYLTSARERRKGSTSSLSTSATFQCPYCPRVCASRIGLSSHTRVGDYLHNDIVGNDGLPMTVRGIEVVV